MPPGRRQAPACSDPVEQNRLTVSRARIPCSVLAFRTDKGRRVSGISRRKLALRPRECRGSLSQADHPRQLPHLPGAGGALFQKLDEIKSTAVYPKSATLFVEGRQPRRVFVLCTSKAKLSTTASDGKTIITKISEAGDVLGWNAAISNRAYEVTAEMIEPGGTGELHHSRRFAAVSPRKWGSGAARGGATQPQLLRRLKARPGDLRQTRAGENGPRVSRILRRPVYYCS
jgi:hypothetical protein